MHADESFLASSLRDHIPLGFQHKRTHYHSRAGSCSSFKLIAVLPCHQSLDHTKLGYVIPIETGSCVRRSKVATQAHQAWDFGVLFDAVAIRCHVEDLFAASPNHSRARPVYKSWRGTDPISAESTGSSLATFEPTATLTSVYPLNLSIPPHIDSHVLHPQAHHAHFLLL